MQFGQKILIPALDVMAKRAFFRCGFGTVSTIDTRDVIALPGGRKPNTVLRCSCFAIQLKKSPPIDQTSRRIAHFPLPQSMGHCGSGTIQAGELTDMVEWSDQIMF